MTLPAWVLEQIAQFQPPETGQVVIRLEQFQTGTTKMEIGAFERLKPPQSLSLK